MASSLSRAHDDRGGIVLGWLTRIVVFFSVAALILFDAISIATTAMTLSDQGATAAQRASESYATSGSLQTAYNVAVETATGENAADVVATKDFKIDKDGTVHLTVSRDAATLIVFRIGPIKSWAHVVRQAKGRNVD